jgi:RNA polymerase sigma-70 factor (ECF subfamily)
MYARPSRQASDVRDEPLQIERAKAGDREAFSQLVRMHQAVVRVYLGAHVRAAETADDLAQEVFLRAFRRLDAFVLPETGSIRPWLMGIARNLLLEHLRAPARLESGRAADLETALDSRQLAAEARDPAEIERRMEALQSCVDKLPPASLALVSRHYFERRTLASLAAEEHKQESALRMRLLRIREALRACIERNLGEGAAS